MRKIILFSRGLIALLLSSCCETLPDEILTLIKTPYSGKEIHLNGCYVGQPSEIKSYEYIFFYSNGVVFIKGDLNNTNQISQFSGGIDYNRKSNWGLYIVRNDSIDIQQWAMSDVSTQFIVQHRVFEIIDDTTLSNNVFINGLHPIYYFRQFDHKPDSTNNFIH